MSSAMINVILIYVTMYMLRCRKRVTSSSKQRITQLRTLKVRFETRCVKLGRAHELTHRVEVELIYKIYRSM